MPRRRRPLASAPAAAPDSPAERTLRTLAGARQELIAAELRRRGSVRVAELATRFSVSEMTVRRDLETLQESGLATKVHGGARTREQRSTEEPGFDAKSLRNTSEKQAIALSAARLVEAGAAIGITAGTTTWHLAEHLLGVAELTVVTNSVRIAEVFYGAPRPDRTVVLTGGVRTPSDALVGPLATAALRSMHLDTVFMGVHGFSERAGFSTPNLLEAETNRAFVATSSQLVVLTDRTKWNVNGLSTICALDEADVLITNTGLPEDAERLLTERVGHLVTVDALFADAPLADAAPLLETAERARRRRAP